MRIGLSLEGPISNATEIAGPFLGIHDAGHLIVPAGFQQRTLTFGFSASLRATTEPDEPEPQTMKS